MELCIIIKCKIASCSTHSHNCHILQMKQNKYLNKWIIKTTKTSFDMMDACPKVANGF